MVVDDVVAVEEEEDEDEDVVEVIPLSERIQRRVEVRREVAFKVPHLGSGDAAWRTGPCARGDPVALGSRRPWEALAFGAGSGSSCHGTADAERPSWSLLPASRRDSTEQPSRSLLSGASPETSPPPKKSKYSQRDREAPCQVAWQRRKEREARRRQQEQEKERKRVFDTMLKAQRPGDCQKYLTAVLDPALFQSECGEQILGALQATNYSCLVENQTVPCSITWRRKIVSSQMEEEDERAEDPNVLAVLHLEELLSMVHNSVQEAQGCAEGQETLQSYVARAMEKMPGKTLALAVVGAQNCFRSFLFPSKTTLGQAAVNGNQEEGQRKGRKRKAEDSGPVVTRMDVEEALLDVQLRKQIQVRFFETWGEFGAYTTVFTKAVAEAPFQREQEKTGLPFSLEKERCRGVKAAPSQKGLLEAWKRQIQQFNRVSLETTEAIVSVYPSPQLLYRAYSRCSSEQEKENMLANIPVCRGNGVTATSRWIGPELSCRIYLQMTAPSPGLSLYFTG
ncbi:LOW QUALITY PROTEIN: crossover junction endonuclease EME1-like [Leptosomus discolor]